MVSVEALLVSLARWSKTCKDHGGLQDPDDRRKCRDTLVALLGSLRKAGDSKVWVSSAGDAGDLGAGAIGLPGFALALTSGLEVSLGEQCCHRFQALLLQHIAGFRQEPEHKLHLADLFVFFCGNRRFRSVLGMLAASIGACIDRALQSQCDALLAPAGQADNVAKDAPATGLILKSAQGSTGAGMSDWITDQMMVGHWSNNIAASAGSRLISMCTDKGRIAGKGKYNKALLLPNNLAWWGVPQVR